jgi:hypothetical protein
VYGDLRKKFGSSLGQCAAPTRQKLGDQLQIERVSVVLAVAVRLKEFLHFALLE